MLLTSHIEHIVIRSISDARMSYKHLSHKKLQVHMRSYFLVEWVTVNVVSCFLYFEKLHYQSCFIDLDLVRTLIFIVLLIFFVLLIFMVPLVIIHIVPTFILLLIVSPILWLIAILSITWLLVVLAFILFIVVPLVVELFAMLYITSNVHNLSFLI